MNRAERRQEARRSFDAAAERGRKRAEGSRVIRAYTRDGEVAFEYFHEATEEPAAQIRIVEVPASYTGPPIRSVPDAEAAGYVDWIRCFLYDPTHPGCYREVPGGQDRLPHVTAPASVDEWVRNFTDPRDEALPNAQAEILKVFPEGEIFPLEALMLAWMRREVGAVGVLEGATHEEQVAFSGRFWEMLQRTGMLEQFSVNRCKEAIARLPALRRRWLELRDAQRREKPPTP